MLFNFKVVPNLFLSAVQCCALSDLGKVSWEPNGYELCNFLMTKALIDLILLVIYYKIFWVKYVSLKVCVTYKCAEREMLSNLRAKSDLKIIQ